MLRQWLARESCGLVSIANPGGFSWPGHWIGIVEPADAPDQPIGVLLFGTPSAVIASPDAPQLVGRGVEELNFQEALILVPFDPFTQVAVDGDRNVGEVVGIYVTDVKTAPMRSLSMTKAIAGKGLEGDRYAAGAGTFTPQPRSPQSTSRGRGAGSERHASIKSITPFRGSSVPAKRM